MLLFKKTEPNVLGPQFGRGIVDKKEQCSEMAPEGRQDFLGDNNEAYQAPRGDKTLAFVLGVKRGGRGVTELIRINRGRSPDRIRIVIEVPCWGRGTAVKVGSD